MRNPVFRSIEEKAHGLVDFTNPERAILVLSLGGWTLLVPLFLAAGITILVGVGLIAWRRSQHNRRDHIVLWLRRWQRWRRYSMCEPDTEYVPFPWD